MNVSLVENSHLNPHLETPASKAKNAIQRQTAVQNVGDSLKLQLFQTPEKDPALSRVEFGRLCCASDYSDNATSPQQSYLATSKKLNLVPQPILLSHMWGVETEINLTGRSFSYDYIKAFSETLKMGLRPGVHVIKCGKNRIDSRAAATFFDALTSGSCQVELLDMSNNQIAPPAMGSLKAFLSLGHLLDLDLSYNALGGTGMASLVDGILSQSALVKLNLCGNPLGELGGLEMARLVGGDNCLITSLGLAWTEMSGYHGEAFCLAASENTSLTTLDLSFNALGGATANQDCVVELANFLMKNRSVTHLDLSYNHICGEDGKRLASSIKKNHSLMGLHYSGNSGGSICSRGFIQAAPTAEDFTSATNLFSSSTTPNKSGGSSLFNSKSPLPFTPSRKDLKSNKLDLGKHASIMSYPNVQCVDKSCWICGNWVEEKFTFSVGANGGDDDQAPSEGEFIHSSFNCFVRF